MSNTNITTTTETTTVTVTENVVEIELNNVGVQGTPGLSGVVSVVSPITNVGSAGSAIVGINQALLSITKSQVSDFTSGTVTSAGTAQQAGTAVFATNASTAVFATTAGTSTTISGTITKSQVSDFTSGTVASAGTAQQSGTAVYAVNAGTATYATTSGTAVSISGDITKSQVSDFTSGTVTTISGSITKSQVSDFTSGTVTSASTAQQSGTAVFATTSGTATYATNAGTAVFATTSGTATYATDAGTAVFATNASTAVSVSGSGITQSQVVNLVSDLANTAKLDTANTFTVGGHVITNAATAVVPLTITGVANQSVSLLSLQNSSLVSLFSVSSAGLITAKVVSNAANQNRGLLLSNTSDTWQSGLYLKSDASGNPRIALLAPTGALGEAVSIDSAAKVGIGSTAPTAQLDVYSQSASRVGQVVRGAASQSANLLEIQSSAAAVLLSVTSAGNLNAPGQVRVGTTSGLAQLSVVSTNAATIAQVVRGAASQTADLLQLQDSAGNVYMGFTAFGGMTSNLGGSYPARWSVGAGSSSVIGMIVRGAASQSANLQEWQNSGGTALATVSAAGVGRFENVGTLNGFGVLGYNASGGHATLVRANAAMTNPGANTGRLYFRDGTNSGTLKLVVRAGAAGAETTILDNIPT
jgi:hypothetical protein